MNRQVHRPLFRDGCGKLLKARLQCVQAAADGVAYFVRLARNVIFQAADGDHEHAGKAIRHVVHKRSQREFLGGVLENAQAVRLQLVVPRSQVLSLLDRGRRGSV